MFSAFKGRKICLLLVCIVAFCGIFILNYAQANADSGVTYKISGYVAPDFDSANPAIKSGFKVELSGFSTITESNNTGYFEISSIPSNPSGYTIKVSKTNYLKRIITNVIITRDLQVGSQSQPVKMWVGDLMNNGVQDDVINLSDFILLAKKFNSVSGDGTYINDADINMDASINIADVIIIAKHFNETSSSYPAVIVSSPTPTSTPTNTPTNTPNNTPTPTPTSTPSNVVTTIEEMETAVKWQLNNRVNTFTITYKNDTTGIVDKVEESLSNVLDNDEYLKNSMISSHYKVSYNTSTAWISFEVNYLTTKEQEAQLDKKIESVLSEIIYPYMSVHEKEKAIHDYIMVTVNYDESVVENDSYSAYTAMFEGKAVCHGYALLAYKMLNKAGIECKLINSTDHMWNLVKIDGKWYHLDCTWDDGDDNTYFYGYYNLSDEQIAQDHIWDPISGIICNTDYLEVLAPLTTDPAIGKIYGEIKNNRYIYSRVKS